MQIRLGCWRKAMASSVFAKAAAAAAKSPSNRMHALASLLGLGGALVFAKTVLPQEAQGAEFNRPEGEQGAASGSSITSSESSSGSSSGPKDELQLVQVVFR